MDSYRDQDDVRQIKEMRSVIEHMRDLIVWLCEEELNSTVTEMEEQYEAYLNTKTPTDGTE